MKIFIALFWLLLCVCSASAQADTLLLLHGYLGSTQEWDRVGIVEQLDSAGWSNAGVLQLNNEVVQSSGDRHLRTRRLYKVALSSEQPVEDQARQLHHYVEYVRTQHAGEQIILVGHSVGGIVARMYMVERPNADLIALITIASPHLGTDKAEIMEIFPQELLVWLEPIPGVNRLYRSQGLFFDLIPNRSDNLIGWLNYQEHPPAQYYSIVRDSAENQLNMSIPLQDYIVPSWSQDMNEIYALRGRNKTYRVKSMHSLNKKDGEVLQKILVRIYTI